ncbi:hypothetical protein [Kitasatospora griseola]|uniref:hypothetical protein n=1 Tax=Kitasatospora griseola TaxID=2064 RepID=UPI0037FD85E2
MAATVPAPAAVPAPASDPDAPPGRPRPGHPARRQLKTRWDLSVDQAEADTMHSLAVVCPNIELTVTLAR